MFTWTEEAAGTDDALEDKSTTRLASSSSIDDVVVKTPSEVMHVQTTPVSLPYTSSRSFRCKQRVNSSGSMVGTNGFTGDDT
jgi:hypothetical protein